MHGDGMELVAHLRQAGQNLRDRFMLDRRAAGPARRIAAENGFGDEGGGGEAGSKDALVEFRPQLFRRAVGDGRFALFVVLLRHTPSQAGDRDPALASSLPRRRRSPPPRPAGGPGGLAARPGRWVSGRESRHLPPVEAGAETPVVVQDAKVLVAGCKGARPPPARWVQGEPKSPCVAMQRRSRCVSRDGLDARQRQRPAEQSLGETLPKSGRALGIALGGPRGMGNPPARCGAVLPRTPCTF